MGTKSEREDARASTTDITQVAVRVNMCLTVCLAIWCVLLHVELQNLRHQLTPIESTIDADYSQEKPESLRASYQVSNYYILYQYQLRPI